MGDGLLLLRGLLVCVVLLSTTRLVEADQRGLRTCTTVFDCADRETCYRGECKCYGFWGTDGPKCTSMSKVGREL